MNEGFTSLPVTVSFPAFADDLLDRNAIARYSATEHVSVSICAAGRHAGAIAPCIPYNKRLDGDRSVGARVVEPICGQSAGSRQVRSP